MSIPTTKELLAIHSKAMANKSDAQYITERIEAGCAAVRDAVIEAVALEFAGYFLPPIGDGDYIAEIIRSLKGEAA